MTTTRSLLAKVSRRVGQRTGAYRSVRAIDSFLGRLTKAETEFAVVRDVNFELKTSELIDFRLFYFNEVEDHVTGWLSRYVASLKDNAVVWDIGANVGAVGLLIAKSNPNVFVDFFEPSPSVLPRLRRNIELNPGLQPRVKVHSCAIGDEDVATSAFYESAERQNQGIGSFVPADPSAHEAVMVRLATPESLIKSGEARAPSAVKIDVEGFEFEVVKGLRPVLAAARCPVVFEHEPYRFRARGLSATSVIDYLRVCGYTVKELHRNGDLRAITATTLEFHCDLVAMAANGEGLHRDFTDRTGALGA